jgi:large-conductance mechanosensitive channel
VLLVPLTEEVSGRDGDVATFFLVPFLSFLVCAMMVFVFNRKINKLKKTLPFKAHIFGNRK